MSKNIITVTKTALNQLKRISNNKKILFSLDAGGCNGFKYKIEPFIENKKKKEKEKEKEKEITMEKCMIDGIEINVCNKSLLYVIGTEIDWKEDYMGSRFEFNNPLAKSKCGCNSSFSFV